MNTRKRGFDSVENLLKDRDLRLDQHELASLLKTIQVIYERAYDLGREAMLRDVVHNLQDLDIITVNTIVIEGQQTLCGNLSMSKEFLESNAPGLFKEELDIFNEKDKAKD